VIEPPVTIASNASIKEHPLGLWMECLLGQVASCWSILMSHAVKHIFFSLLMNQFEGKNFDGIIL
jgi:hypothetical protein